jgi:hypothetical protein
MDALQVSAHGLSGGELVFLVAVVAVVGTRVAVLLGAVGGLASEFIPPRKGRGRAVRAWWLTLLGRWR